MLKHIFILSTALSIFTAAGASAEDKVDFEKQIQPIFVEHCIKCHGEKMASGKMRLHTAAGLKEKWDADKELIVAGEPEKSELYQRLVLPADDKKRMPKNGRSAAEGNDRADRQLDSSKARCCRMRPPLPSLPHRRHEKPAEAAAAAAEEKPAEPPLPEVAAAPKEAIDKLTAAGAQVMPLFADSSLLQVSFAHRSEPAGDAEIALLAGVADQVYALEPGRCQGHRRRVWRRWPR